MKKKPLTVNEIAAHPETLDKRLNNGWANYRSAFGRTEVVTDCPFCGSRVYAYLWSLAGHGFKRCDCGAVIGYRSEAYKRKSEQPEGGDLAITTAGTNLLARVLETPVILREPKE